MKHIIWNHVFPFLQWFPLLTKKNIKADVIAGITGAIVVLPQGVAFATIAGMPPEYGLYAAMIPAIVAALFGSSWHLISGPTTAASLVMLATLSAFAEPATPDYVRLALTLTFLVGVTQLVMGLARLGTLVNFISHSVIIGFTAGAAILILASQVKTFLGMDMPRGLHPHEVVGFVIQNFTAINPYAFWVALITLITGVLARRISKAMPYMLVAMVVGSIAAMVFNGIFGEETTGLKTIGALAGSFPPLSAPDLSLATIKELAPAVLAVTLLALTEAVSISRSIAVKSGQHVNGNQEFVGQGLSNIAGSFFSAYVATGSFNRSGLNYEAGAKSPLAAIVAGFSLIFIVMLVAPYAAFLPTASMAGILFIVAWGLIDFHHIKKIIKTSGSEASILGVTFFSTLLLELEFAILLGVTLSLVVYLNRTSKPRVYARAPDPHLPKRKFSSDPNLPECPQLKLLRIDGSLFFGAVDYVAEKLLNLRKHNPQQKHLLLLCQGINFVDVTGAELMEKEAKQRRAQGGCLYLYQIKPGACEILKKGYLDVIGRENVFWSKSTAISHVFSKLDKDICKRCDKRIFYECESVPKEE
ncbi:MAG: SulP family inorganic anion transporter [Gammaproteobacteria bacterium]|nr:SulP family inorganic anion transporter [Gammaproteobacteria bacterium]